MKKLRDAKDGRELLSLHNKKREALKTGELKLIEFRSEVIHKNNWYTRTSNGYIILDNPDYIYQQTRGDAPYQDWNIDGYEIHEVIFRKDEGTYPYTPDIGQIVVELWLKKTKGKEEGA